MAYLVMAYTLTVYVLMAYTYMVMAYTLTVYIRMAYTYTVMAYMVMATHVLYTYTVMAYMIMATHVLYTYTVMACMIMATHVLQRSSISSRGAAPDRGVTNNGDISSRTPSALPFLKTYLGARRRRMPAPDYRSLPLKTSPMAAPSGSNVDPRRFAVGVLRKKGQQLRPSSVAAHVRWWMGWLGTSASCMKYSAPMVGWSTK